MCVATMAIQKSIDTVAKRLGKLPDEIKQRLEKTAQLDDMMEAIAYQNLQARSHAAGHLRTNDALWLYHLLGGEMPSVETFNKHGLAERIVAMEVFAFCISIR